MVNHSASLASQPPDDQRLLLTDTVYIPALPAPDDNEDPYAQRAWDIAFFILYF
jgi:hypothetical protein